MHFPSFSACGFCGVIGREHTAPWVHHATAAIRLIWLRHVSFGNERRMGKGKKCSWLTTPSVHGRDRKRFIHRFHNSKLLSDTNYKWCSLHTFKVNIFSSIRWMVTHTKSKKCNKFENLVLHIKNYYLGESFLCSKLSRFDASAFSTFSRNGLLFI
jgi:hypothetical protein